MSRKNVAKTIIIMVVIGALILLAINSNAIAQEGGEEPTGHGETEADEETRTVVTVPGGPGFVSVIPHAFRPKYDGDEWVYLNNFELYNPAAVDLWEVAPINLPHGAVVNKFVLYYFDDTTTGKLTAWLYRHPLNGAAAGSPTVLAIVDSITVTGGYADLSDTSIGNATIDNANYTYFIQVKLPGNFSSHLRLTGIRIDYGYPSYLPSIMN